MFRSPKKDTRPFPVFAGYGQKREKLPQWACPYTPWRNSSMSEHTYKVVELVGSSTQGTDKAIQNAIARAAKTLRNLDWFEVVETRGHLADGKIAHWQVKIKVGFRMEA
jgi:flavin-binding protein dodecin